MNGKSNPAAVFYKLFGDTADKFNIEIIYENSKRVVYCEKTHRVADEKYILSVSGKEVKIYCSCEKGAFYALCDLAKRIDENTVSDGEFICSPSFSVRGYIEGFYGTPWSHENRKSVMKLMAKNRMNTVYYAPKDDLYHREKWRENYPEDELERLKALVDCAKEYYMNFYWCIAPGLSMKYSDDAEFDTLINKTKQLYSIGIRCFGLLLDDIDEELVFEEDKAVFGETVNAHIELINRYYSALKKIDSSIHLTVCPTLYHGKGSEYYISKLGKNIPTLVSVFWTGRDICSRELTSPEAVRFIENTFHKPLYWDNYPVNDCSMFNEMHISPIIGRDPDLYKYSEGIISNCMEYAECSKIPLITFADYLWDSENYDPQKSWESAIRQVVGKENADNFIIFADHLYTSCLKDANSRRMYEAFDEIETAFKSGNPEKALALAENYLGKMNACRDYLKQDLPICRELSKWSEKYFVSCEIINKIFEYIKTKNEELISEISLLAEKYESMPAKLSNDVNIHAELKNLQKFI
ncbi:MAG: beta-N-acetylglucosaminidase domain-containing protein [Clostridia bacterium]|nr:beta-N-acetylglucosaminidase domain-containing protein [Clostridia bacterium]MBR3817660.1 beta-N-acetylglucosaminidase domain-containing protein [Clostridia bacterium]